MTKEFDPLVISKQETPPSDLVPISNVNVNPRAVNQNNSAIPNDLVPLDKPVSVYLKGSNEMVEMPSGMLDRIGKIASGAYDKGNAATEINSIYFKKWMGDNQPFFDKRISELQEKTGSKIMTQGLIEDAIRATAEQTPQLIEMAKKALVRGTQVGAGGAAVGAAVGSFVPGIGTAGGAVTGGARGFQIGAQIGIIENSFIQNTGSSYEEYSNYKGKDGKPLGDTDAVRLAALVSGASQAGLDVLPMKAFSKIIPFKSQLMQKLEKTGAKSLVLPKGKDNIAGFVRDLVAAQAIEVGTEGAQEGIQAWVGEGLKKYLSDQDIAPAASGEILKRVGDVMKESALSIVPIATTTATVGKGIETGVNLVREKKAQAATKPLDEKISDIAKQADPAQEFASAPIASFSKEEQTVLKDAGVVDENNNVNVPTGEQNLAGVLSKIQGSRRDGALTETANEIQSNIDNTVLEGRLKKLDDNISTIDKQIDVVTQLIETKQNKNQATVRDEQKLNTLVNRRDLFDEERANILTTQTPRSTETLTLGDKTANIEVKSGALSLAEDANVTLKGSKLQNIGQTAIRDINKSFREGRSLAKKDVTEAQNFITTVIDQSVLAPADKAKFIRTIKNIQDADGLTKKLPEIQSRISNLVEAASRRQLKSDIKSALSKTKTKKQSGKPVGKFGAETQKTLDRLRNASKLNAQDAKDILNTRNQISSELAKAGQLPSYEDSLESTILSSVADSDNTKVSDLQNLKNDIEQLIAEGKTSRQSAVIAKKAKVEKIREGINQLVTGGPASLIDTRGMGKFYHGTSQEILELNEAYYSSDNIYGNGFYSTDAVDIASSYKKRKKNAVNPIIYSVKQKSDVKFFDLDSKIDLDSKELSSFKKNLESDSEYNESAEYALSELLDGNVKTYSELLDESRKGSVKDEFQDLVTNIQEDLKKQGYGGFEHTGGKIVGKKEHQVRIYWEPENQIELKEVIESDLYETPEIHLERDSTFKDFFKESKGVQAWLNYAWGDILDAILPPSKADANLKKSIIEDLNISKEIQKEKGIQRVRTDKFIDAAKEAFGFSKEGDLHDKFLQDSKQEVIGVFVNSAGKRKRLKYSKAQARKFWMELQDPSLKETIESPEGMGFTPEMIAAVTSTLDHKDISFAKAQLRLYEEFYPEINKVYRLIYGVDLPSIENYSPISRIVDKILDSSVGEFLQETFVRLSIAPGSLKSRVNNLGELRKSSDIEVYQKHIVEMSHFIAMQEKVQQIQQVFGDKEVRKNIEKVAGKLYLKLIDENVESFAKNGAAKSNFLGDMINYLNRGFALSVLGGKMALTAKQATSIFAYWDEMSAKDFVSGVIDFAKNPKKAIDILNQSELVKARGVPEYDLAKIGKTNQFKIVATKNKFIDAMLLPVKFGDKGAILIGGWAYYKNQIRQGKTPDQALQAFEEFTAKTQQSTDLDQITSLQRSGAFGRTLTMFLTAPNAYYRAEVKAIRQFKRGEISGKEFGKKLFIYHILLPATFQFVANGFTFDEEDQLVAVATGPLNGFFILGDLINNLIREAFDGDSFQESGFKFMKFAQEVKDGMLEIAKSGGDMEDVLEGVQDISKGIGRIAGLPVDQAKNMAEGIDDFDSGRPVRGTLRFLGYPKKSVEEIDN